MNRNQSRWVLGIVLNFCFCVSLALGDELDLNSNSDACKELADTRVAIAKVELPENQLSFRNAGGMANGGVCWWHSRLTRAAALLAYYRPDLPKPNEQQVRKILRDLQARRGVVQIPGYSNLKEFSAAWQHRFQKLLESWQASDGIVNQEWSRGLFAGGVRVPAHKLKRRMDDFYQRVVVERRLTFAMLQYEGITAHAWLISNMIPTANGYDLRVIDSNYPGEVRTVHFENGQEYFQTSRGVKYSPVLAFEKDLRRMENAIQRECR